jgi:hypothetical protein
MEGLQQPTRFGRSELKDGQNITFDIGQGQGPLRDECRSQLVSGRLTRPLTFLATFLK